MFLGLLGEIEQGLVGGVLDQLLVGLLSEPLEQGERRPDLVALDLPLPRGQLDVGEFDEALAVPPELLVDLVLFRVAEDGAPPFEGVVVFQVGAGVGDDGVTDGVGLVEAVLAPGLDEVPELLGVLGTDLGPGALHPAREGGGHLLRLLFRDIGAELLGLGTITARQLLVDPLELLLVGHDPVGLRHQLVEDGEDPDRAFEAGGPSGVLDEHVVLPHLIVGISLPVGAEDLDVEGTGAVESGEGRHVLDAVDRFGAVGSIPVEVDQQLLGTFGVELEDSLGPPFGNVLEDLLVLGEIPDVGDLSVRAENKTEGGDAAIIDIGLLEGATTALLHQLDRVLDVLQGVDRQEVHLEAADGLDARRGELGDRDAADPSDRDELADGPVRDDPRTGMAALLAGESEALLHQLPVLGVAVDVGDQRLVRLQRAGVEDVGVVGVAEGELEIRDVLRGLVELAAPLLDVGGDVAAQGPGDVANCVLQLQGGVDRDLDAVVAEALVEPAREVSSQPLVGVDPLNFTAAAEYLYFHESPFPATRASRRRLSPLLPGSSVVPGRSRP